MKNLPPDGSMEAGLLLLELTLGDVPLAYEDIAEVCGVSYQNIQNTERRALRKMREEFIKRGIDERYLWRI
jgi:DNA-directed RNA polymerase sigma subunit (sigma70/sigma32)